MVIFAECLCQSENRWQFFIFRSLHIHSPLVCKFSKLLLCLSTSETTVLCSITVYRQIHCTGGVICMVVVRGVAGSKVLRYFMNTLHSKKFQGHFRWLVLTQSCADDLITLSVCLWIYSLDQIISACPQQGWRTHPFLWYFAWKSDQKWKPLIWMYNKCINLKKTCRHHGFQWFPVIIHNQALLLSSQIVPSESLNLYHWSDAEAFGIRLCNRIHFVNRSFSVLSVVTEAFTQNKHTHTDCPLDIHVG